MEGSKKKILILDDEPEMLGMISQFLAASGFEVMVASDGQTGLEMAQNMGPDLILTDIQMPKIDGWVICTKLKSDPRLKHIPIIMLSGLLAVDAEADKAIEKCDYLMAKPVEMKNLLQKVQQLLNLS